VNLAGFGASVSGESVAAQVAARVLGQLGAAVRREGGSASRVALRQHLDGGGEGLLSATVVHDVAGLPPSTIELATGIMLAAAGLLAYLAGDDVEVDRAEVAVQVLLPRVLGVPDGRSTEPRPIGDGSVAVDLATPEDAATFERLLDSLGELALDAEAVAAEAQRWRLPVCAFRRNGTPSVRSDGLIITGTSRHGDARVASGPERLVLRIGAAADRRPAIVRRPAPLDGVTVCDMTSLWAGPLATFLLASAGATVHKVEPDRRLDGFRDLGHPDAGSGRVAPMFAALNRGKQRAALDLDRASDRAGFDDLVAGSDLLVTGFSRRVLPNLGIRADELRRRNPKLAAVALHAFPLDHEYDLALGSGVHAASGLGDTGRAGGDRFAAAVVSYPDPLAGFALFVAALAQITAQRAGRTPTDTEVSLWSATVPLLAFGAPSDLVGRRDDAAIRRLVQSEALDARGVWEQAPTPLGPPKLPRAPFRSTSLPVALGAPPDL
jgi:hypothetical protein